MKPPKKLKHDYEQWEGELNAIGCIATGLVLIVLCSYFIYLGVK